MFDRRESIQGLREHRQITTDLMVEILQSVILFFGDSTGGRNVPQLDIGVGYPTEMNTHCLTRCYWADERSPFGLLDIFWSAVNGQTATR